LVSGNPSFNATILTLSSHSILLFLIKKELPAWVRMPLPLGSPCTVPIISSSYW
jgi:hypothetical protein